MAPRLDPGAWLFLEGFQNQAGSLGLPVRDADDRSLYFLTAAHVVGGLAPGRAETDRVLTNPMGAVPIASIHIGHAAASAPAEFTATCEVDAALISPLEGVGCGRSIGDVKAHGLHYDSFDPGLYGLPVQKYGARSGLTVGMICEIGAELVAESHLGTIRYPFGYWIMNQTAGVPFALPGDSGSMVVDLHGRVVGLIVAMQNPAADPDASAFCIPIEPVLRELNVELIGPR